LEARVGIEALVKLIPTRFKERLPRGLVYPTKARDLSKALAGAPQFSDLTIGFYRFPAALAKAQALDPKATGATLPLLKASYLNLPEALAGIDDGALNMAGETWELTVFGVPKVLSKKAQEALAGEGFPRLLAWLTAPRDVFWRKGRKSLEIRFQAREGALEVTETG